MRSEDRRDLATATVGAGGVALGGQLRHAAIRNLKRHRQGAPDPKVHAVGILRHGTKGHKQLYGAGAALGLAAVPALAVGTTRLVTGEREEASKALKVTGLRGQYARSVPGQRARREPTLAERDEVLRQVRTLRNSAGRPRATDPRDVEDAMARAVRKRDEQRGFLGEGLRGAGSALGLRGKAALEPVPKEIRAQQLGVAAGAGFGGGALARMALRGRAQGLRPTVSPVVGALAATASVPATNKLISRKNPDYEVTAFGVRRKKGVAKKPSTKAFQHRPLPRSFREDLAKRAPQQEPAKPGDKRYLGARTPYIAQRAAITAAGHPPIVGPLTQAASAGAYAPPGQEKKQALRQYGMASFAPIGVGVAGAYAGANRAAKSPKFERFAERNLARADRLEGKVRSKLGVKPKVPLMEKPADSRAGKTRDRFLRSRAGQKLLGPDPAKWKARMTGAGAGFLGAKMAAGGVLGQAAISLNQRDQEKYNREHGISKAFLPRKAGAAKQPKYLKVDAYDRVMSTRPVRRASTIYTNRMYNVANAVRPKNPDVAPTGKVRRAAWEARTKAAAGVELKAVNMDWTIGPASRVINNSPLSGVAHSKLSKRAAERRLNASQREKHHLAEKKRASAALSLTGGALGLSSLGLFAAGKKNAALGTSVAGGGVGGFNALLNNPIQRGEAKQIDPLVKKRLTNLAKSWRDGSAGPAVRRLMNPKVGEVRRADFEMSRHPGMRGRKVPRTWRAYSSPQREHLRALDKQTIDGKPSLYRRPGRDDYAPIEVGKRETLEIRHKDEHPKLLARYGDKGPLPKGLDRETKMRAYEARYVRHGGDKADKYGRRADVAEGTRNVGLGLATAAGAGYLATRGPKAAARKVPRAVRRHAETAAVVGGTLAGGAELYGEYARGRRASYTNSPAGVAGSALRRMRDYTPE